MGQQNRKLLVSYLCGSGVSATGRRKTIAEALEADALAKSSERIEVHASITGKPFYHALGYTASLKHQQPDREGLYLLEKIRTPE